MTDTKDDKPFKEVRLEWKYPDDLQTRFASNIVVQHQPDFFTISFFETLMPIILAGSPQQSQESLKSLNAIEARCVAKIIVTPEKMRQLLKVIEQNLVNYDMMMKEIPKSI